MLEDYLNCKIKLFKTPTLNIRRNVIIIKRVGILSLMLCLSNINLYSNINFEDPIHKYFEKNPKDIFSEFKILIESGKSCTKRFSDDLSNLKYLLDEFNISHKSQILVFSNTSLQLSKISPSTPRAIFFSDDIYFGYVPNGKIEIIGIDPEIGAIPYIFSLPQYQEKNFPIIYRSRRCMRCHASEKTDYVPGLLMESVIPISGGGTLDVLNRKKPGHSVPYELRFGGWFLSGSTKVGENWANKLGTIQNGNIEQVRVNPKASTGIHLNHTSDPIAHIVLEHQIGLVNLCIKIQYKIRESKSRSIHDKTVISEGLVKELLDYVLFKNEPKLPNPLDIALSPFARQFQELKINPEKVDMLREFDLKTRLFKYPCSYMINNRIISSLPKEIKELFYAKLVKTLDPNSFVTNRYSHLVESDKISIDQFLFQFNHDYRKQKRHL